VGVPTQKENELLDPEGRREENGEKLSPFSSDSEVWENVVSSPSGGSGQSPAENGFIVV